jgi:hypothetical protein
VLHPDQRVYARAKSIRERKWLRDIEAGQCPDGLLNRAGGREIDSRLQIEPTEQ